MSAHCMEWATRISLQAYGPRPTRADLGQASSCAVARQHRVSRHMRSWIEGSVAIGGKCIQEREQVAEDLTSRSLGQDVSEHQSTSQMHELNHLASAEVAEEVGGTQDVLGLLEGHGVESHLDGGLRVAVLSRGLMMDRGLMVAAC